MLMKRIQFLTFTLLFVSIFLLPTRVATAKPKATLEGHTDNIWSVAFRPNGLMLASASWDQTVRLWNVNTGRLLHTLRGHTDAVNSVAFSPDGKTLVSASWDGTIRLWNPNNGKLKRTLTGHKGGVGYVAFSPDGRTLASGSADQTVRLWNTTTWKLKSTLTGHTHVVDAVAFSPDDGMLASGSRDKTIRLWNPRNGKHIKTLTGHTSDIVRLMFSSDGATLASGGLDKTVRLWNPNNGKLKKTLTTDGWVNPVAFSSDGATLLIGGHGISIWDTQTGQYTVPLDRDTRDILSVVFSPDGQMVASGSTDHKVRLWDFTQYFRNVPFVDDPFDITNIPEPAPPPATVRDFFQLDPFYQQWINVKGLPILASAKVSPYAVKEAAYLISQMIGHRQDILQAMAENGVRFSVIAYNELTTHIPEYSHLRPSFFYNLRNRGTGGQVPTCGEENLLNYADDPYWTENVLIHEFAHTLHNIGLHKVDPSFDNRLRIAYEASLEAGLWQGTYAATNRDEYWAEGTQSWFNSNEENGRLHNHVNTRVELKDYDPNLAALLIEIYGDRRWRYTPPATRTHLPHLQGFNPEDSPTFEWSPDLVELYFQLEDPDIDDGGEWVNLPPHTPNELASLNESRTISGDTDIDILVVNLTGIDVLVYRVASDGTETFLARQSDDIRSFVTDAGDIWLLKDKNGDDLAVFRAEEKIGRILVDRELLGLPPIPTLTERGIPGPKIEGPWLWMMAPTGKIGGAKAAASGIDWLAEVSGGSVTEQYVAINGVTTADEVGNRVWTIGELSATDDDNINKVMNATGLGTGNIEYHVAYGYITLDAPNDQDTRMFVGSDDAVKVWLNGVLVHDNPVDRGATDYQEDFPVTLKQGTNILLVAVYDLWGDWSGYFGFENDAAYTVSLVVEDEPTVSTSDVNQDGQVNVLDLVLVAQHLGHTAPANSQVDVNGDGAVNILDLVTVAQHLGESTGVAAPSLLVKEDRLDPAVIQSWIAQAYTEDDGSLVFQQGIANLQRLLALVIPKQTILLANYPNPFNPETWIPYQLAARADVSIAIYAADGRLVRTLDLGHQSAGTYETRSRAAYWDGRNTVGEPVASGVYFYTLTADEFRATRKMLIRK